MQELESLKGQIQTLLNNNRLSGKVLLDNLRVIDESSRKTGAYTDSKYAPFYYQLGKVLNPTSMIEVGVSLGLLSTCFFKSCKTVKRFIGFQEKTNEYYSPRLALSNIKDFCRAKEIEIYVGKITDNEFTQKISPNSLDLVILNVEVGFDKQLAYLDFLWSYMSDRGIIVSEYIERHTPAKEAFFAFCESKNRTPAVFKTRFGSGLVQK
jgi:predicted O-methyltransferase YrrM